MAFSAMPGLVANLAWRSQRSWTGGVSCAPADELPFHRGRVTASCHSMKQHPELGLYGCTGAGTLPRAEHISLKISVAPR